ncbi:CoA transferase subunit A [Amycolatopsis sp. DSM 110486]|uniref:CoA transferase subunit A n=1 Tax=Amycolatopsis sp. DSM 110486 TaxID=2865832 RepID=UPI001C6967DA|nr:3-oxoacid CoA-transferase subunit A [Amycolatopsis sp. DSM 110486]QYN21157.1 3-oxoacid CoA-transferase subunit A [Amycolatopsis sp. DSM 110486]
MNKVVDTTADALAAVADGQTIALGGFGLCGTPAALLEALLDSGATDLHLITNNCGPDTSAVTELLRARRVSHITASYIGDNTVFLSQYLRGSLSVDLVPQGTLAEKLRAGGAGIPAFYTPTGVGTAVAEGGIPLRYGTAGVVAEYSTARRVERVGGRECLLEHSLTADLALIRAEVADTQGNLRFRASARNFNPLCAMAARVAVVEVVRVVDAGTIGADDVHLPGVFVSRVLPVGARMHKPIERLRVAHPRVAEEGKRAS